MAYVITNVSDDVFLHYGDVLDHMENGYPRLVNEDVAFPPELVNIYKDVTIPEGVEPIKFLYTEKDGFTANPNYVEPNKYGIPDDLLKTINADYTEQLVESGVIS